MTRGDPSEHDVVVLQRNRRRLLTRAWPLLFALFGVLMLGVGDPSFLPFLFMGLILAATSLSRAYDDNVAPDRIPTRLVVTGRRMAVDGANYDIDAIRSGYLLVGEPPRIRLYLGERRLPVDVAFSSRAEASGALDDLELSPRQRVATFESFATQKRGARGVFGTLALVAPFTVAFALFADYITLWIALMVLVAVATKSWRRWVHVGSDGLRLERGLWFFDRFIPHEAITSARLLPAAQQNEVHVDLTVAGERDALVGFHSRQQAEAFIARQREAALAAGADSHYKRSLSASESCHNPRVTRTRCTREGWGNVGAARRHTSPQ